MTDKRGRDAERSRREMRSDLNAAQLETLEGLERFGFVLKFVRRPIFQPSIPVLFDPDRKAYAILELDGTVNDNPPFVIRPD
ncbi:MAG: hypothetical protein ABIQ97_05590 [Lysobacteraceae bacterium]